MMKRKYRLLSFFLLLILLTIIVKKYSLSLFWKKTDRVNIVIYGENTVFYSIGFGVVSYSIVFPSDLEMLVPGGYKYYRVGAIGKLASLEKKPDIIRNAFSSATSSFIDVYFYPNNSIIYYDNFEKKKPLKASDIFFSRSNANLFDRLYIYLNLVNKNERQFNIIDDLPTVENKKILNETEFVKKYQGLFYERAYRNENKNIQIIYNKSYKTAVLISRIIEGEGIRVVDISQSDKKINNCEVKENSEKIFSLTSIDINRYLHCQVNRGETDISDIILSLGELEREWKVE